MNSILLLSLISLIGFSIIQTSYAQGNNSTRVDKTIDCFNRLTETMKLNITDPNNNQTRDMIYMNCRDMVYEDNKQ